MIRLEQTTKTYPTRRVQVRALDGVDFAVDAGEFVVVKGPSGCGKSTLLLCIGGMLRPTSGTVQVASHDIYQMRPAERARFRAADVGFVFQMFHLVPYLSVWDNLRLGRRNGDQTRQAIERFGMTDRLSHRPAELSAGEQQRIAVLRAVLKQPKIILADEPTGSLDPVNSGAVLQMLHDFHTAGGTIVLVSHSADADDYADRIVMMDSGRIAPAVDIKTTLEPTQ